MNKLETGAILISIFSTLSLIGSLFILFTICFFGLYKSRSHRLIAYLSFADLFQAIGIAMSYAWTNTGGPVSDTSTCHVQGFFISFGDVASAFWACAICLYTLTKGIYKTNFKNFEIFSIGACYLPSLLFASTAFAIPSQGEPPFYGPAGASWCWVSAHYDLYRFVLHYLWIFLVILIMAGVYSWIAYKIYVIKKNTVDKERSTWTRMLKKLAGYPIAFTTVFAPLGICRIAAWAGRTVSVEVLVFSMCIFALNGLFNAIVYGFTRSVFKNYYSWYKKSPTMSSSALSSDDKRERGLSVS